MQDKSFVVDSINGDIATLENHKGELIQVSASCLPKGVKEQDWLRGDCCTGFKLDLEKTKERRDENISLFEKLKAKNKPKDKGDFTDRTE